MRRGKEPRTLLISMAESAREPPMACASSSIDAKAGRGIQVETFADRSDGSVYSETLSVQTYFLVATGSVLETIAAPSDSGRGRTVICGYRPIDAAAEAMSVALGCSFAHAT